MRIDVYLKALDDRLFWYANKKWLWLRVSCRSLTLKTVAYGTQNSASCLKFSQAKSVRQWKPLFGNSIDLVSRESFYIQFLIID